MLSAISSVTGATIGDSRGHVIIAGNDTKAVALPTLDVSNILTVEGQDYADFVVRLSAPGTSNVTVNYQLNNGTALASYDYIDQSGFLTFAPGETVKTVRVATIENATIEAQETFNLQLFSPTNAILGNAVATATIIDNDSPPPAVTVTMYSMGWAATTV